MLKLLGEYLRSDCGLTCHQIVLGLRQQVILRDSGIHVPLGWVLVDLGFITEEQLASALEQQQYDLGILGDPSQQAGSDSVAYT